MRRRSFSKRKTGGIQVLITATDELKTKNGESTGSRRVRRSPVLRPSPHFRPNSCLTRSLTSFNPIAPFITNQSWRSTDLT